METSSIVAWITRIRLVLILATSPAMTKIPISLSANTLLFKYFWIFAIQGVACSMLYYSYTQITQDSCFTNWQRTMAPTGMTIASLRRHYYLLPLFAAVGIGCVLSTTVLARAAFKPEIAWNKRSNNDFESYNRAKNKKFPEERPAM